MKSSFKLNNTPIKRPDSFKIERYHVTKANRLANASMSMELIAKKRKFYFTYNGITSTNLNKILDIIWESNSVFYDLSYVENNIVKSAVVYVGSIPSELHMTGGVWVWKDVNFNLIER